MQTPSGGVDRQRGLILQQRRVHFVLRARFGKAAGRVIAEQRVDDGPLHTSLTRRHARESRFDRPARHRKPRIVRNEPTPIERSRGFKQRLKIGRGELGDLNQNAVGGAQPKIGPTNRFTRTAKVHTARPADVRLDSQIRQLATHHRLETKCTGSNQFKRVVFHPIVIGRPTEHTSRELIDAVNCQLRRRQVAGQSFAR